MFNKALSLICNPRAPAIDGALTDCVREALAQAGVDAFEARELSAGVAVDFLFAGHGDAAALRTMIFAALRDAPVDVNVVALENRRKRLIVADMDSTIIEQECIDEIADYAGRKAEIADITDRAMRGELDFEQALTTRVAMLKGLSVAALERAYAERISLTPGARTLVATMNAHGAYAALVSGGFTFFTSRVAALVGFNENRANTLLIENGALVGDVARPILGREAKEKALVDIAAARGLDLSDTLAVGDGANDLGMIGVAGLGVAFHAKPAVAAAASAAIRHGDLTSLLFLQGYSMQEFVVGNQ